MTSNTRVPLRSRNAFRPTVVPWTRKPISRRSGTKARRPSSTPSAGSAGVVGTLPDVVRRSASSRTTRSVNVPPMSIATRKRLPAGSATDRLLVDGVLRLAREERLEPVGQPGAHGAREPPLVVGGGVPLGDDEERLAGRQRPEQAAVAEAAALAREAEG